MMLGMRPLQLRECVRHSRDEDEERGPLHFCLSVCLSVFFGVARTHTNSVAFSRSRAQFEAPRKDGMNTQKRLLRNSMQGHEFQISFIKKTNRPVHPEAGAHLDQSYDISLSRLLLKVWGNDPWVSVCPSSCLLNSLCLPDELVQLCFSKSYHDRN